jgi:hypothetical protein
MYCKPLRCNTGMSQNIFLARHLIDSLLTANSIYSDTSANESANVESLNAEAATCEIRERRNPQEN